MPERRKEVEKEQALAEKEVERAAERASWAEEKAELERQLRDASALGPSGL